MNKDKENKDMGTQLNIIDVHDCEIMPDNWFEEILPIDKTEKMNDVYKVYSIFKYVKLKKDKQKVFENKKWDMINFKKSAKSAKEILEYFDGDVKKAAKAVMEIGEHFERWGGSWSLSAVFRNITEWEEGRLVK